MHHANASAELKIAEVVSRIESLADFIRGVEGIGFKLANKVSMAGHSPSRIPPTKCLCSLISSRPTRPLQPALGRTKAQS